MHANERPGNKLRARARLSEVITPNTRYRATLMGILRLPPPRNWITARHALPVLLLYERTETPQLGKRV